MVIIIITIFEPMKRESYKNLPYEYIDKYFKADEFTGEITRSDNYKNKKGAKYRGYLRIGICGKKYQANRQMELLTT